jgi:putative oxidoreductase
MSLNWLDEGAGHPNPPSLRVSVREPREHQILPVIQVLPRLIRNDQPGTTMNKNFGADIVRDEAILVGRVLLVLMFLVLGWSKMANYSNTVDYFGNVGLPLPGITAIIAISAELIFGVALLLGVFTRPLAIFFAVYTIATALIGHHYWTLTGGAQVNNMIHFYKNVGIAGGFILLYVIGPGKYSIDSRTNMF